MTLEEKYCIGHYVDQEKCNSCNYKSFCEEIKISVKKVGERMEKCLE